MGNANESGITRGVRVDGYNNVGAYRHAVASPLHHATGGEGNGSSGGGRWQVAGGKAAGAATCRLLYALDDTTPRKVSWGVAPGWRLPQWCRCGGWGMVCACKGSVRVGCPVSNCQQTRNIMSQR